MNMTAWNNLNMKQRAELMKIYLQNGITSLSEMRGHYNEYAAGGHMPSLNIELSVIDPPKNKIRSDIEAWGETYDDDSSVDYGNKNSNSTSRGKGVGFDINMPSIKDIKNKLVGTDAMRRLNTYLGNTDSSSYSSYEWDMLTANKRNYPIYNVGDTVNMGYPYGRFIIDDRFKNRLYRPPVDGLKSGFALESTVPFIPFEDRKEPYDSGNGEFKKRYADFVGDLTAYDQINKAAIAHGYPPLYSPEEIKSYMDLRLSNLRKGKKYNTLDFDNFYTYVNPNHTYKYKIRPIDAPIEYAEILRSLGYQKKQEEAREENRKWLAMEQAIIDAKLKPYQEAYKKEVAKAKQNKKEQEAFNDMWAKQQAIREEMRKVQEEGYEVNVDFDEQGNVKGFSKYKSHNKKSVYKPTTYKVKRDANIFKYPTYTNYHSDALGYTPVEVLEDGTLRFLSNDISNNGKRITYHTTPEGKLIDYSYAQGGYI